MTNLEAIKGRLGYPLTADSFNIALINQGIIPGDTYPGESRSSDLAYANSIVTLLTSPQSIDEGGFRLTKSNVDELKSIAQGIFDKYGLLNPISSLKPTATFVRRW